MRGLNIILCLGCRFLCQLCRFSWSFLILQMTLEFNWTGSEQGSIKAAYAGGYLLSQIPGGIGGAKIGNKFFQCLAVGASGLGLLIVPPLLDQLKGNPDAPSSALVVQVVCFAMGLCAGPQHPTATAFCKGWCVPAEKSWTSSLDSLSSVLSSIINTLVVATIVDTLGWRYTMLSLGGVALAYLFLVIFLTTETPSSAGAALTVEEAKLFRKARMLAPLPGRSAPSQTHSRSRSKSASPSRPTRGGGSVKMLFTSSATWCAWLLPICSFD